MAYGFYRTVTIDHTKCGASDSTNFPIVFTGTYTYLKTTGNGGNVTSSSGFDIVFATDATGLTLYDFELAEYHATTGLVEFWIRIPTLSHTVDTVIYLFYGNAAVTTYQGTTSTWNANYIRVYHVADLGAATPNETNSTSASATLTYGGGSSSNITPVAGKIGGAAHNAISSTHMRATASGCPASNTAMTLSNWVKTTTTAVAGTFSMGKTAGFVEVYLTANGPSAGKTGMGDVSVYGVQGTSTTLNDGNWHYVVGTTNGSSVCKIYVDGILEATNTQALAWDVTENLYLFNILTGGFQFQNSDIDEAHILNVAVSADWVTTEFNNQNNPATFYAVGSAVTPVSGSVFYPGNLSGLGSGGPFFQNPLG